MVENHKQRGSIRARKIDAENVANIQLRGIDASQVAALENVLQALEPGEISADEIKAITIANFQYIRDPDKATTEDVRKELSALRKQVDTAIAAQEIPDSGEADDVKENLESAEKELAKAQPNGKRALQKLDEANKILTKSAELAQSANKVGAVVIKIAPVAVALWQVIQKHFGL